MPLQKILFKPGVNRENTRYTNEGGWYDINKMRFRQGTPETIGGWTPIGVGSTVNKYLGFCRSLWTWVTLQGAIYNGVGTNLKFYIEAGGIYNDITPIRSVVSLSGPFKTGYSTLAADITATQTSLSVASGTSFSPNGGIIKIGTEQILYGSVATNSLLSLTRGYNGTTAAAHSSGTAVASATITVTATANGALNNDFVTYGDGAVTAVGGITAAQLKQEYELTYIDVDTYSINARAAGTETDSTDYVFATSAATGGGTVIASYQVNTGPLVVSPQSGWGSGGWGLGLWGIGATGTVPLQIWSQWNWGENLVFSPTGGGLYYWTTSDGLTKRSYPIATGIKPNGTVAGSPSYTATFTNSSSTGLPTVATFANLILAEGTALTFAATTSMPTGLTAGTTYYVRYPNGATCNLSLTPAGALISTTSTGSGVYVSNLLDVPTDTSFIYVSDTYRFLMAFGCNPLPIDTTGTYVATPQDPMMIRWADQESLTDWYPSPANQAGFLRLSHGSRIVTAVQTRQEIFVITDSSAYSLQYVGTPYVWRPQLMADSISIMGYNAASFASGIVYWMGDGKFYKYDGRIQTLRCDLRQYIFNDINLFQSDQIFSGTNEAFNEVWWFYCSANSDLIDKYVVYNYAEDIWYYGTMSRTAWLDSGLNSNPIAASTDRTLVNQESGLNDNTLGTDLPITAYITSAEFDIGDGHNFGFVWRMLPDITFRGSTAESPSVTMTLYPLQNSGSGYLNPASEGGFNYAPVTQTVKGTNVTVEQFTGQVYVRVRGRQMAFKVTSAQLNTAWQLGAPRIDIKQDGRR